MARMLTLLAILGVLSASSLVAADDNCTVSPVVTVQPAYTFNVDDYIFVDGDFDQFQTCDDVSSLVWTVNGVSDYGRYFYEPAAQFGPGTYAGRLDVYLSPYYYGNYTLSATYDFNVTVLNQTTPTDAPSGSGACVPSPTVVLDSNYVFGSNDYISIDGDFSYFRSCDLTASLTWLVTGADNVAVYNTSGWSFYSYPGSLAPGDYNGTLQVFLGDDTTPASETTFGLTIVNGSVPTDAPATDAPSGSGTQCYTSPTVLLQSDYYFDVSTDVSIYGDYYYFQSCDQLVNLQWAVGALNSTGYSFWEPADTFAIGSYPGSLNVYFGDNETLVASYSFTVTIGNDTQPTFAPFTDAPFTDAPPAPCEPEYSVFLSSNYWFEKAEDIVINPDLDFFNTCGVDYELDWTLSTLKETGSSFFATAGALTVGDYSGSLNVLVNGTLVNSQFFNVTVYDGNATAVAARAVAGRRLTLIKLRAAKKAMAMKKPRSVVARALARAAAGSACSAKKLAVGLKLKYTAASTSTVAIRPNVRKLVGCGTHPALVWRVGRAVSTGRQMTLRRGAFAPGAYMGTLEVHSGRTVVKHTFLVVVEGAKASTSYKYQPEAKMQARLLGSTRSSSSASASSTSAGTTSKTTMIVAGAAGVSLVALVAVGIAFAMRRRSTAGSAHDVERQSLVQHA